MGTHILSGGNHHQGFLAATTVSHITILPYLPRTPFVSMLK